MILNSPMKPLLYLISLILSPVYLAAQSSAPEAFFDAFMAAPDSCTKAEMDKVKFTTWMRLHYPTMAHLERTGEPLKIDQVLSASPLGVKAMTNKGVELVPWSHFPGEYRSKLGLTSDVVALYSQMKSAQVKDLTAQRQSAQREAQDLAAASYQRAAREKSIYAGRVAISLRVSQALPDGCLCYGTAIDTSPAWGRWEGLLWVDGLKPAEEHDEPIYIIGLPATVVDGDKLAGWLYPCGVYRYTTVAGGSKSVRKYAATLKKACAEAAN